jgi:hypothetical protein
LFFLLVNTKCLTNCSQDSRSFVALLILRRLLQGEAGIALELPDQRGFVVQIALPQWFYERVHQVFDEMPLRI